MSDYSKGTVLVLNCGSSSVKYQVVCPANKTPIASGLIERVTDFHAAIRQVIDNLEHDGGGIDLGQITVVGHRVVQGGSTFVAPTIVTDEVEEGIEALTSLAPLHTPPNLAGIRAAREAFPDIPHVAVFDTAFHATMPESAYTYAIDKDIAREHGVRKYGFHGTSHGYVARTTARLMGKNIDDVNMVTLHLGNGASACAIRGGKSIDTSMGLTPLQGLVMGTRSGDIDPAVILHLRRSAGMTVDEIDELLNRGSGMLGLSGHSDMRDVEAAAAAGDPDANLALEVYCRRVRGYLGAYLAHLGRIDAVVFTAGVGENSERIRWQVMHGMDCLGITLDPERNAGRKKEPTLISADSSRIQVWVTPTNEELAIAMQAVDAVS